MESDAWSQKTHHLSPLSPPTQDDNFDELTSEPGSEWLVAVVAPWCVDCLFFARAFSDATTTTTAHTHTHTHTNPQVHPLQTTGTHVAHRRVPAGGDRVRGLCRLHQTESVGVTLWRARVSVHLLFEGWGSVRVWQPAQDGGRGERERVCGEKQG